jgi:predicted transcriptional regulator
MRNWGFITNHGLVLASIARHPRSTARQIGDDVGLTERAALRIISELDEAGYISKDREGRQNVYRVHTEVPLKEDISDAEVGELLIVLGMKRRK